MDFYIQRLVRVPTLKLIVTSHGALPRSMAWRTWKEIELGILDPTSARDVFYPSAISLSSLFILTSMTSLLPLNTCPSQSFFLHYRWQGSSVWSSRSGRNGHGVVRRCWKMVDIDGRCRADETWVCTPPSSSHWISQWWLVRRGHYFSALPASRRSVYWWLEVPLSYCLNRSDDRPEKVLRRLALVYYDRAEEFPLKNNSRAWLRIQASTREYLLCDDQINEKSGGECDGPDWSWCGLAI